jgi:thymidylate synthase (FAD)
MKLINQSFEILEQKDFTITGIKKFIERCGRVCYKSQDRITDNSYEKFVDMLEKRDHARPLEFGTVHLQMYISDFHKLRDTLCINNIWNDQWIKYHYAGNLTYVTTNYRYYLAIIKVFPSAENDFDPQDDELYPKRYTVHFITSRGIMDEFRTHIGLSHLAESTRYCNYSKDKFNNQITFIKPSWITLDKEITSINELCLRSGQYDIGNPNLRYLASLVEANYTYILLLNKGWTPQQAREVLPLSIKSELISCGFEDAWSNFFYRRCAKDAHPMAREIATKVRDKFKELNYVNQ